MQFIDSHVCNTSNIQEYIYIIIVGGEIDKYCLRNIYMYACACIKLYSFVSLRRLVVADGSGSISVCMYGEPQSALTISVLIINVLWSADTAIGYQYLPHPTLKKHADIDLQYTLFYSLLCVVLSLQMYPKATTTTHRMCRCFFN